MQDDNEGFSIAALTTEIVTAYVGHQEIAITDLGRLIVDVGHELGSLGHEPETAPTRPEPAVPVRRSVKHDHLVCLVCGKPFKSLRRHLQTAHDLTPNGYREMFDLPRDYPMIAAASSQQRAAIARQSGLGRRPAVEAKAAVEPETAVAAAQPVRRPIRGRRAAKKTEATAATGPALQPQPEPESKPKRKRRTQAKAKPKSS
jgi:predicted transcriptional regulator